MRVVITGGTGFIGQRLARALLDRGELMAPASYAREPVEEVVLFDQHLPPSLTFDDPRIRMVQGEIADHAAVEALIDSGDISVFHLASVVSGGGEKDFDLAMRVNLDGMRHLLEVLRKQIAQPRLIFASSIAVFGGGAMPARVGDSTKQTPQTTYGITKTIGELLINDYTRKGYIDGRSARLPTVIIRPGRPNAAASSFVSGLFREPLNGKACALPVGPDTVMPVLSYRAIVEGLICLHELDGAELGDDRAVSLPALTVSVQDMLDALRRVAGGRLLGEITFNPDPFIQEIVAGWPRDCYFDRALALGLPCEASLDEIVAYYIADYLDGAPERHP